MNWRRADPHRSGEGSKRKVENAKADSTLNSRDYRRAKKGKLQMSATFLDHPNVDWHARDPSPPTLYSTHRWIEHFELNRRRQPVQPWAFGAKLTPAERRIVIDSIKQFQLGESGEGRHLKQCAIVHAERTQDSDFPNAVKLFIAEEQWHSCLLRHYLDLAGESRLTKSKVDGIFRWLRHRMGLEFSLIVLSTAEVVATVYYRAPRDATECELLRSICRRILRDEAGHLAFHRDRFLTLRWKRPLVTRSILRLIHHGLLMAALLPVWWCHGRVFARVESAF